MMTENALNRDFSDDTDETTDTAGDSQPSGSATPGRQAADRVLRTIATQSAGTGSESSASRGTSKGAEDWTSTLQIVQEACESIRISEERVALLENELEEIASQYRDDLRTMSQRLSAAQDEIRAAVAKMKAAEARANEAESWLARINDAIQNGFGPFIERAQERMALELDTQNNDH